MSVNVKYSNRHYRSIILIILKAIHILFVFNRLNLTKEIFFFSLLKFFRFYQHNYTPLICYPNPLNAF